MVKLIGVFLLIGGTSGFAFCLCREQKSRLRLLKDMKYMYQLLQNEIRYTGLPLPEIFKSIAEKLKDPLGSALIRVSESMAWERGESFSRVWEEEMEKGLLGMPLTDRQKSLLLRFPESTGLSQAEGQAKVMQRQIEELDRWIAQLEQEEKSKNKVIMSLGIAAGIFLSILLL